MSLNNSLRLLKNIPEDRKIVIESGISGLKDIQLFTELNVNTFLIGRYLIEQGDPGSLLLAIKNAGAKSFEN